MRLGGACYAVHDVSDIDGICKKFDAHGLSALQILEEDILRWDEEKCRQIGHALAQKNIVVGEVHYWQNMMVSDRRLRTERIERFQEVMHKAELLNAHCVVSLIGTRNPSDIMTASYSGMWSENFKQACRDNILRMMENLAGPVKYAIEPWFSSFFQAPEEIAEFLEKLDHPNVGLHWDQCNMLTPPYIYDTAAAIENTYSLLRDKIFAVHLKDLVWEEARYNGLHIDEVLIGRGNLDQEAMLKKVGLLDENIGCFCEHLEKEEDYIYNFKQLHAFAKCAGTAFVKRAAD